MFKYGFNSPTLGISVPAPHIILKYLCNNYNLSQETLLATLERLKPIKGRYTYLSKLNKKIVIDSAHTPASFKNILKYIRSVEEFKKNSLK